MLTGHEREYVGWFLASGTAPGRGVDAGVEEAYTGREALRCGFEHYRAMATDARQIEAAVGAGRLTVPTMAVGGGVGGDATYRQLLPVADDLAHEVIPDCGHLIPLERPEAPVAILAPFVT